MKEKSLHEEFIEAQALYDEHYDTMDSIHFSYMRSVWEPVNKRMIERCEEILDTWYPNTYHIIQVFFDCNQYHINVIYRTDNHNGSQICFPAKVIGMNREELLEFKKFIDTICTYRNENY